MRALIFHDTLFAPQMGSSERFLRDLGTVMEADGIEVWYSYRDQDPVLKPNHLAFKSDGREVPRPFRHYGMQPSLDRILGIVDPDVFIGLVWDRRQFPYIDLPADLPVIQVSPFGSFCPVGNVQAVWVSGEANLKRAKAKGAPNPRLLFNPLPIPPVNERKGKYWPVVHFGRAGRPDAYDPILLDAWKRIEEAYPEKAALTYVAPCPEARAHAERLCLRRITFRPWIDDRKEFEEFLADIDVFCHARRDGETLGVTIVEAMLAQCPVITHRSKHNNGHIDAPWAKALLVAKDVEEYARHMARFVSDEDMRRAGIWSIHAAGIECRKAVLPYFDGRRIWPDLIADVCRASQAKPSRPTVRQRAYKLAGAALEMIGA